MQYVTTANALGCLLGVLGRNSLLIRGNKCIILRLLKILNCSFYIVPYFCLLFFDCWIHMHSLVWV